MYKIKGMCGMRRERRKRKSSVTAKLARMTKMLPRSPSTRDACTTTKLSQNVAAGVTKPAVPGVEDGVTARAADEEEVEGGAAEAGRRRV